MKTPIKPTAHRLLYFGVITALLPLSQTQAQDSDTEIEEVVVIIQIYLSISLWVGTII